MGDEGEGLRKEIIGVLKKQGFSINPHLHPDGDTKEVYKKIHQQRRVEKIQEHKNFLLSNLRIANEWGLNGKEIEPERIKLEIREVKQDSFEAKLFLWWDLVWWSIPYEGHIGRQLRFIIWDVEHEAPFGLIRLQSAPLRQNVRDITLGIKKEERDYWVNMSMYAQRVGALPPYNELLGGKMVALSLTANEVREAYREKYEDRLTLIKNRKLPAYLLFVTTTATFGKSSIYERLNYKGKSVSEFLGYTAGSGTFHLPEELYQRIIKYLQNKGINTKRENWKEAHKTTPSRKLKLINLAFEYLGMPNFAYHNIPRGFYLFSNVENLRQVIQGKEEPIWYDRPFRDLSSYWLKRWGIPRAKRTNKWREFNFDAFMRDELKKLLFSSS